MGERALGLISLTILKSWATFFAFSPRFVQIGLGKMLGRLFALLKMRKKVVEQNLDIAIQAGALSRSQRDRLLKQSYENLGQLILECLMLFGPFKRFIRKSCELRGYEYWSEQNQKGKGVLFLSSHVGNWEIMAATGAEHGMDLMIVTKRLKPEWLHRAIENGRRRVGVKGTYEPKTLKDALRHLKAGGSVGVVLDQYAGPPIGVRVPFFGVHVGTATVLAALARRTGVAVLPVVNYRTDDGKVITEIRPALEWSQSFNPTEELAVNTAKYVSVIEGDVRRHLAQWLWIHRRFKGDLSPISEGEWARPRIRASREAH